MRFLIAALLALQAAAPRPVTFENVAQAAGVTFAHVNGASADKYLVETMGSGGLLFDYDNDGWVDLFLVDGGSIADSTVNARARHRLFRNVGKGAFRDVTESSGIRHREYGMGACAGDVDNDGRTDLYITNYGPNALYRNAGNGVFTDVTRKRRCRARGMEHELCVSRRRHRRRSRFVRDELPRCAEDQQSLLRRSATPHPRVLPPARVPGRAKCALSQRREGYVHGRELGGWCDEVHRQRPRRRRGGLR